MAAMWTGFARHFQSFTKRSNSFKIRNISAFTDSPRTCKREKASLAAFLLGCVGLVGFSGIYFLTLNQPLKARSEEEENDEQKNRPIPIKREVSRCQCSGWSLQSAIDESRSIVQCMKEECGCPGVCVAVSVNGETVWSEGFGFADIENRVLCSSKTVMRIASISKPLTATAAAKLWEEGKLDLDAPIQTYVASFPEKTFNGATVTLTTRHLLSHLGGIRSYKERMASNRVNKDDKGDVSGKNSTSKEQVTEQLDTLASCNESQSGFPRKEFLIMDHFKTVADALSLFKDDPLLSIPGTNYLYTTHGWTVVSAVIEGAANQDFLLVMKKLFKDLGMKNTCADFHDKIIHNRARFYQRNMKGHLINAPYVDNSWKWAGGGFLSTVEDLLRFGNCLLYAKQMQDDANNTTGGLPGFLQPETVSELWKIVANTEGQGHKDGGYGLGWEVIPEKQEFGACHYQSETVLHIGKAVGSSSILLIRPTVGRQPPKGVVVTIMANLQEVNLEKTAMAVATCFQKTHLK